MTADESKSFVDIEDAEDLMEQLLLLNPELRKAMDASNYVEWTKEQFERLSSEHSLEIFNYFYNTTKFKEFFEKNKESVKKFLKESMLADACLIKNLEIIKWLLKNKEISIELFKNDNYCIRNKKFYEDALKENILTDAELRRIFKHNLKNYTWYNLFDNQSLVAYVLRNKLITKDDIDLSKKTQLEKFAEVGFKFYCHYATNTDFDIFKYNYFRFFDLIDKDAFFANVDRYRKNFPQKFKNSNLRQLLTSENFSNYVVHQANKTWFTQYLRFLNDIGSPHIVLNDLNCIDVLKHKLLDSSNAYLLFDVRTTMKSEVKNINQPNIPYYEYNSRRKVYVYCLNHEQLTSYLLDTNSYDINKFLKHSNHFQLLYKIFDQPELAKNILDLKNVLNSTNIKLLSKHVEEQKNFLTIDKNFAERCSNVIKVHQLINSYNLSYNQSTSFRESLNDEKYAKLLFVAQNNLKETFQTFESLLKYLNKHERKHALNI